MSFLNKDLIVHVGVPVVTANTVEDQLFGVGNSTPPNAGGATFGSNGNVFTFYSQTGVGNGADTTEDTLKTFSLPANSLDVVGRSVYIYAWGSYANNTNTKAAKLYFGSTSIAAATGNNVGWALEMIVGKSAANKQVISSQNITSTTHGGVTNSAAAAETDTAAITIKVTGQDSTSANANAIVLNGMYINFFN